MNTSRPIPLPFAPPSVAALLALAVFAFWIPYFSQLPAASRYVHFHVVTTVAWMGLLIVQPLFMRAGRRDLHRTLGKSTYALMPLMFLASVLLAHHFISQPGRIDQPGMLQVLVLQTVSPLLVAGFYAAALHHRRTPAIHARWMLATALLLIDPIVARVLAFWVPPLADAGEWLGPLLAVSITLGLIAAERRATVGRHVFPVVLACVVAQVVLYYTLGTSAAWRAAAQGFIALNLT